MKSAKKFKKNVKSSKGGMITRLTKEVPTLEVRFLFEMEDGSPGWEEVPGYWNKKKNRSEYVEDEKDIPSKYKLRENYFAVAWDVKEKKVILIEMRKLLVQDIVEAEEEYGNITDRDYKLKRRGQGRDKTDYTALPTKKYKMTDEMKKAKKKAEKETPLVAVVDMLLGQSDS